MKILHVGNLCNNSYVMAKFLRRKGIEADLLLYSDSIIGLSDPEWEDEELSNGYPSWIKIIERPPAPVTTNRQRFELLRSYVERFSMMRRYDLIHASCMAPIFVQFCFRPYVAHCMGSDILELAQENSLRGKLMKGAYEKAEMVLYSGDYMAEKIVKHKLKNSHFFPLPMDVEKYSPLKHSLGYDRYDFIIFHPTALDWTYKGKDRVSTKGNDRFFRAVSRFVRGGGNPLLIVLDRGVDVESTHELISKLDLGKNVIFLPEMKKKELINFINGSDLIVDQFDVGGLGGIAREAMCCGKPVLMYVNTEFSSLFYQEPPPILNAHLEDEIYERLIEASDARKRRRMGRKAREWILKHFHWEKITNKLIFYYNIILGLE